MRTCAIQLEGLFFGPSDESPSAEVRALWCDPKNPANPFHKFIGNESAVRRLCRAAFAAFARCNRECSDQAFALIGPPSTGKSTLARMFGELIRLPFVEVDPHSCSDMSDVAVEIARVMENTPLPNGSTLELQDLGDGRIVVPPCIVFVNEVDKLPKKVEQGLRQAFAGRFSTNGWTFDSSAICWIVASDEYLLPDAFDRFLKLVLKPLGVEEVAQVVALHNPELPAEVCRLVAQHVRTPREALAFAAEMKIEFEMHGGNSETIAATVARDWGVEASVPWINRVGRNGRH